MLTIREHLIRMNEHKILKSLVIPADASPAEARHIIEMAIAQATVNERRRRLRKVRRENGTCTLERAVDLAEALGYDTSRNWGQKAVAFLMRVPIGEVRQMMEPETAGDPGDDPDDMDSALDDFLGNL